MADKPNRNQSNEDAILNRLIRLCRGPTDKDFVRPDETAIAAYLLGTATEPQEGAVKAALMRSAEFRREILGMAEDMDALRGAQAQDMQKKAQLIRPPAYADFLKTHGVSVGRGPETLWMKLTRWRIPQMYAPVAVAAAIVALIVIRTGVFTGAHGPGNTEAPAVAVSPESTEVIQLAQWSPVEQNLERGLLISNVTREAAVRAAERTYGSPKEAALAGFRSLLKYKNGQFYANPSAKQPKPAGPYRSASLILVNEAGKEIKHLSAEIPISGAEAAVGRPEAWALTIPSRDLYKLDLRADTTRVEWTAAMGDPACITFIYPEKRGYRGAVGAEMRLP